MVEVRITKKQDYLKMFYPGLAIGDAGVKTIIQALLKIQAEGRTRIIMIAGSDRVAEFQKLLNQYNGKPDKQGNDLYKFDSIDVVSAGQRDPDQEDLKDYQTVFANKDGAVAAPTAGLHFTERLLDALGSAGILRENLTLHVGAGTFLPVKVEDTNQHKMHSEWGKISSSSADRLNTVRNNGGRIIAEGTPEKVSAVKESYTGKFIRDIIGNNSMKKTA